MPNDYRQFLKNMGLTDRQIDSFLNKQKEYANIQSESRKINKKYIGKNKSPIAITTEKELYEYISNSARTPKQALRSLRTRQINEEKRVSSGYTNAIFESVKESIKQVRQYYSGNINNLAEKVSANISQEDFDLLSDYSSRIYKYIEAQQGGSLEESIADEFISLYTEQIIEILDRYI